MVQQQLFTGFRDDIGAVAERKDDVSQYMLGLCRSRQYTKISTPLQVRRGQRKGWLRLTIPMAQDGEAMRHILKQFVNK